MQLMVGFPQHSSALQDPKILSECFWPLYYNYNVLAFFVLHKTERISFNTFCAEVISEVSGKLDGFNIVSQLPNSQLLETWCHAQDVLYRRSISDGGDLVAWIPAAGMMMWTLTCPNHERISMRVPFPDATGWVEPATKFSLTVSGWESREAITPALEREYAAHHIPVHFGRMVPLADSSVISERKKICSSCEWYDAINGRCAKCGCSGAKLHLKDSKCPVGKW